MDASIPRFSFEPNGARGTPGYDSYLSPRMLRRTAWFFVRRLLGIDTRLPRGDALDTAIEAVNERHWSRMPSVDRLVLLAFDEYHDDDGNPHGAVQSKNAPKPQVSSLFGSDLYVSNSFVRAMCEARPDRYLFGSSIHPYRTETGASGDHRDACDLLTELSDSGAVLVKWLPIHQNIRADDPRTVAFLRQAAELNMPMLIHYGGEMSLSRQHMEFEHPGPMLEVLRQLRAEGTMPTVIVAHVATPSFPLQSRDGFNTLVGALLGEFRDAPLYADISALAAFGRTGWLRRLADMPELHPKLVWGSDYPIPVLLWPFWWRLDRRTRRRIASIPSWVEQDIQLKRALGYEEGVFTRAAGLLGIG